MIDTNTILMNTEQIKERIPHRDPFLLIENVHEIVLGEKVTASKRLTEHEPVFAGHFPGNPIYPGVYYVEAIAQTGAILIFSNADAKKYVDEGYFGVLASIQEAKFRRPCKPGDLLCYEVTLEKSRGLYFWLKGKAFVNNELASEARISVALIK